MFSSFAAEKVSKPLILFLRKQHRTSNFAPCMLLEKLPFSRENLGKLEGASWKSHSLQRGILIGAEFTEFLENTVSKVLSKDAW